MTINLKKLLPHVIIVLLFITASLIYFYPVLQGKTIYQSDIVQYTGMAKEQNDFRKKEKEEPYWTNRAFGGMPTYQLGANYPNNFVKKIDKLIRFLPRPADYLFLYLLSFYILLLVLKVDYKLAFLGSLAFGFSTYLIIILGVGHNAKAHAIGYFPLVLAGILLTFQKKYVWGFLLTTLAMALEIGANHFQMTYYLMLLVLVLGIVYLVDAYKKKELPHFFKTTGILVIAVFLGIIVNASNLLATQEYVKWSTRSKSELTFNPDGSPKEPSTGLDREYITQYSYGIGESLNLFVPRLFGGGNSENLGEDSNIYKFLRNQGVPVSQAKDFSENVPTYWGNQPIVAAPAYIGAVIIFLFVLGLFLVKGRIKWWLLGGVILSLLLSWGKNLGFLTNFMIDYFPMYNKFRAVSSIQVILELCVPVLAVFSLMRLLNDFERKEEKLKALKYTTIITAGLCVLLFLFKGTFSFDGVNDEYYRQAMGPQLVEIIKMDRMSVYNQDLFRSLIYVLLSAGIIWFYLKGKLKERYLIIAFAALIIFDLVGVNKRYVNKEDFVQSRIMERPFTPNTADKEILKDNSYFRVFDPSEGLNGARTSYFHNSIGGYHAAKPKRLQELYEYQIAKNNMGVLNMLNIKYIIQQNEQGQYAANNPYANGNAWFVEKIIAVNSANEEMKALDSLNTTSEAVINTNSFNIDRQNFIKDSLASIKLTSYKPNLLKYKSSNHNEGLAVFSEMYYPHGWKATIDGKEAGILRVNYSLRGLQIPAGTHEIEFRFEPRVVQTGSLISLMGTIVFLLLLAGGIFYEFKYKKTSSSKL
ncbi:YfhO family protein [Abyssalbus ytuae]|uniref:YfhO family protein n=1 Tax=Abyssalbus ytuae TaxID=2926907 RepID=A0A9E7A0E5_9FLAO|nr:YfhO family protein [Abyssalbus ytuae]UOB17376.1 YfhO family protein [Abyssalbus ytuae]